MLGQEEKTTARGRHSVEGNSAFEEVAVRAWVALVAALKALVRRMSWLMSWVLCSCLKEYRAAWLGPSKSGEHLMTSRVSS